MKKKRKKIIAELQDQDKEKKLSDSTKDLGEVSVYKELSKRFKSPSTPIIFIPMANAMSSGSIANIKSLQLKNYGKWEKRNMFTYITKIPKSTGENIPVFPRSKKIPHCYLYCYWRFIRLLKTTTWF